MTTIRRHLQSNAVGYVALFIALGLGTAYGASKVGPNDIAKNAIHSKHIKNGQVKEADLQRARFVKVRDNPLTGDDPCRTDDGFSTPVKTGVFCGGLTGGVWFNTSAGHPVGHYGKVGFRRIAGVVHLSGFAASSFSGPPQTIFILPRKYRPPARVGVGTTCLGGAGTGGSCLIDVTPSGRVEYNLSSSRYPGGNGGVALDGISFPVR